MKSADEKLVSDFLAGVLEDRTVRHGPFQGMTYPFSEAAGSALVPKLLGTYESELHETFGTLFEEEFSLIVDVGCAEGYYAVGLAIRFPEAQVIAIDIDKRARSLCKRLAAHNDVAERVRVVESISDAELRKLCVGRKSLVISDCEGFESEFFAASTVNALREATLIVEAHDFIDPHISGILEGRFSSTHSVSRVQSVDDLKKSQTYEVAELAGYDLYSRRTLLAEHRPTVMEWLVAIPANLRSSLGQSW